jgi:hypothetical protein
VNAEGEQTIRRTWQVTVGVIFPNAFPTGATPLPTLQPQSRIPTASRDLGDGVTVYIRPGDERLAPPSVQNDIRVAVAALTIRLAGTDAESAEAALAEATPYADRVLESLAFQMQETLPTVAADAIDLTGDPAVGEKRAMTRWSAFATPTFWPVAAPVQSLAGAMVPDLAVDLDPSDRKANRALDWYLKALNARYEADHFMFLWIATDILAGGSEFEVTEPYKGPQCGHEIAVCPDCGKPTTKPVQGGSRKRFLTDGYAMDASAADRVWTARQMLHGAHAFDSAVMRELPDLSQRLRAVLVAALKERLGMAADALPIASPAGATLIPIIGLGGERPVTQADLDPLSRMDARPQGATHGAA